MSKITLTLKETETLAIQLANQIKQFSGLKVYGIPRGGISVALMVALHVDFTLVDDPDEADIFIDDIIDSGKTVKYWNNRYPDVPFLALIDKRKPHTKYYRQWVVFPWEGSSQGGIEDNIIRTLQYIGDDPKRQGLEETPKRVAKALDFWFSGYDKDPKDILKVFEDGAENCDEMVIVKDIPFYSHCEHHMAPIFGTATIAYIPNGKIVGLSKLSRVLDMYARRLQVQERLTNQVAEALMNGLEPLGVGVLIKARHLCMESRGICQQGHYTITSALQGVMRDTPEVRAEFMSLANG